MNSEKLRGLLISVGLAAVVLLAFGTAIAQRPVRIKFERGATRAVVSGYLSGYKSKQVYVIRVRSGQTLRTEQKMVRRRSGSITIFVKDPAGEGVGDSDASCNNRREISPTVAGDYRIEVVECQKADPWRGNFRFNITVR